MFKINFVKFFPVESPITDYITGVPNNAGIDIYMPKPTLDFVNAILKSNENVKAKVTGITSDTENIIQNFCISDESGETILTYMGGKYYIYQNIQIPSGLGLLIPSGYYVDLRSKSSNFKNYYTSIMGLIDSPYTYGMSVQIHIFDSVEILPDEKFAQFILKKSYEISILKELSLDDWNNNPEVKLKRIKRTGGFGTTGKLKSVEVEKES